MKGRTLLNKKILLVALVALVIAAPIIASNVQASETQTASDEELWLKRATKALEKAEKAINHAINKVVEQAELGTNVTLAKNVLKASIKIYGTAERKFGEGNYKKAFFMYVLSGLVSRDSARIAVNGSEALYTVMDEVAAKIEEVKGFLEKLAELGVNVSQEQALLQRAEEIYVKAEGLLADGKEVKAVVAVEVSRILAHAAEKMAKKG